MPYELPPLPYEATDLAPYMSTETLNFHYGRHHKGYADKMNELTDGAVNGEDELIALIKATDPGPLFNNAAQVWNHNTFWRSMKASGGGEPDGELAEAINSAFGSFADFKAEFKQKGIGQFGSGYVWLVTDGSGLSIIGTPNAETPLTRDVQTLLTCDVWEHAYYLDHRNARPDFLDTFLDHLVNWQFAEKNLQLA